MSMEDHGGSFYRKQSVTEDMVERATRAEYEKHNEGDDYDAEPESIKNVWRERNRFIITAALAPTMEETP
jgi:hypothetical protein